MQRFQGGIEQSPLWTLLELLSCSGAILLAHLCKLHLRPMVRLTCFLKAFTSRPSCQQIVIIGAEQDLLTCNHCAHEGEKATQGKTRINASCHYEWADFLQTGQPGIDNDQ